MNDGESDRPLWRVAARNQRLAEGKVAAGTDGLGMTASQIALFGESPRGISVLLKTEN